MQSKDLDQRITLQQRQAGRDAAGQQLQGWADVATVWANVRSKSARDFLAADAQQASAVISVAIRNRPDVTGAMRMLWRGAAYDIVGEPTLVERQWLRFDAASGVRDAR